MNKFAEFFEDLGLIKTEPIITTPPTQELTDYNRVSGEEQAAILARAEEVIFRGVSNVQQAPYSDAQAQHYPMDEQRAA